MARYNNDPLTYREMLETYQAPVVQTLARKLAVVSLDPHGSEQLSTRKGECIDYIVRVMKTDSGLQRAFAELSENEKRTIGEIVHHEDDLVINTSRYYAIYNMQPAIPDVSYNSKQKTSLYFVFVSTQGAISYELAERLKDIAPLPREAEPQYLEEDPQAEEDPGLRTHLTEQAACHDLLAVLQLVAQKAIKVSATTGIVTEASAMLMRNSLLNDDFYAQEDENTKPYDLQLGKRGFRMFAWPLLLQSGGLATVQTGKLVLTKAGEKSLTQPAHVTLRKLWERWVKYTQFHEFSRLEEIKGQKSSSKPLRKPTDARQAIADALALLAVNRWIDIDDFFSHMFAQNCACDVVRDGWPLYHEHVEYGSFGYNHITWRHLNGRFVMAVLLEYCATLGMIDVTLRLPWEACDDKGDLWGWEDLGCISRYDGLTGIRLTPLGAWVLELTPDYTPATPVHEPTFKVLPNADVILLRAANPGARLQLLRIAEPVSEDVYHLSTEKIIQSLEEGMTFEQMLQFFDEQVEHDLPPSIRELLDEIDAKRTQFTLDDPGYLIRCKDAALIAQICKTAALKTCCLPVGNDRLFLHKGKEKVFAATLRKMGFVPPSLPGGEG